MNQFRTKVECAGQCLAVDDCEAFLFEQGEDKIYTCWYKLIKIQTIIKYHIQVYNIPWLSGIENNLYNYIISPGCSTKQAFSWTYLAT